MKRFLKTFAIYILILIGFLFVLEFVFTYSYYNPKNPRSKVSWIMSMDSKDTLDYALFGSSRCIHSIDPTIINEKLGTNGLNLAYAASNPLEVKLSLKTLLKKKIVKRIFVQVDYSYNQLGPHPLAEISWMPFIKEDYVYDEFRVFDKKYWWIKSIPFYRYMIYDSKIGIRDLIFNYTKKGALDQNSGYVPLYNVLKTEKIHTSQPKKIENPHLKAVIEICEENGIKVDFFTAPIYKFEGDHSALNKLLPNYKDFSTVVSDRNKFQDNTHINHEGAKEFTELFMTYYFQ
ncbi:MAG: hypothetical protein HKO72_12405 [Flavobacteriaceae bacterium]|nr:hypothetical protein [Bacteroidia bacterium]NNK27679.1 hypothetical protein [Flavobacteriaceae bacterium]NNL62127.1 hypothetical protein [Flavobacteriaceae bacterium]